MFHRCILLKLLQRCEIRSSQEAFIFKLSCKPMNITVEHYSWFQMQQNKFDIEEQAISCFSLTNSADPKWNTRPLNTIIKPKRDRTSKQYCQITHIQRWFLSFYNMIKIIHIKIHSLTHLILQTGYPKYSRNGSSMLRTPLHRTTLYGKSFTVTACRLWNSLPFPLRSI